MTLLITISLDLAFKIFVTINNDYESYFASILTSESSTSLIVRLQGRIDSIGTGDGTIGPRVLARCNEKCWN